MPLEYWSQQRLVVNVDGPAGQFAVTTDRPFARIGSHRHAEVVVPAAPAGVAAYLHATAAGIRHIAIGEWTTSGDSPYRWLGPDALLYAGDCRLWGRVLDGPGGPANDGLRRQEPFPLLAITIGDEELARGRLSRPLSVVGRGHPSTLRIGGEGLAWAHAVLCWEQGRLWVIDLFGPGGTRLDGCPVDVAVVAPGSVLTFGNVELRYVMETGREGAADASHLPSEIWQPGLAVASGRRGFVPFFPVGQAWLASRRAQPAEIDTLEDWHHLRAEIEGQWEALDAARQQWECDRQSLEQARAAAETQRETLRGEEVALAARRQELQHEERVQLARRQAEEAQRQRLEKELDEQRAALAAAGEQLRTDRRAWEEQQEAQREALRREEREQMVRQQAHEAQWQQMQAEVTRQQAAVEAAGEQLRTDRHALEQQQAALEARRAELRREESEQLARRQAEEAERQRLQAELTEQQTDLETQRTALRQEEQQQQARHQAEQSQLEQLSVDLQRQRGALVAAGEQLRRDRQSLEELHAAVETDRQAMEQQQRAQHARQEEEESKRQELLAKLHQQQAALEATAAQLRRDRQSLEELHAAVQTDRQALAVAGEQLHADRRALESLRAALETDRQSLQEQEQTQRARHQAEEAQRQGLLATLHEHQAALAAASEQLHADRQALESLRAALEADRQARTQQEQAQFARDQAEGAALRELRMAAVPAARRDRDRSTMEERRVVQQDVVEQEPLRRDGAEGNTIVSRRFADLSVAALESASRHVATADTAQADASPNGHVDLDDLPDNDEVYVDLMGRLYEVSQARQSWWRRAAAALASCFGRVAPPGAEMDDPFDGDPDEEDLEEGDEEEAREEGEGDR